MRSKQIRTIHIPNDTKPKKVIDAKPYPLFAIAILVGIVLFVCGAYAPGIIVILLVLGFLIFLPTRRLIEFYDEYMVIYNCQSLDECKIVYYDEVSYYIYHWGVNGDELELGLIDSSIERIECFSKMLFESYLKIFLPDKRKKTK